MKNTLVIIVAFCLINSLNAQDSLSIEKLKDLTYTFNIEDGKLTGEGAKFLIDEMSKAQFTMVGEYHGSMRISEFTNAIIPVLDSVGYKTMALEVGPISGQFLNNMTHNAQESLKVLNNNYLMRDGDYVDTPIPFFDNIEDALFLNEAKQRSWSVIGIDQEGYSAFHFLKDQLFNNLNSTQKNKHKLLYTQVSDSITDFYLKDNNGGKRFPTAIKNSPLINNYFEKMAEEPNNIEIIGAIKASNHIFWLNVTRKWFENSATRVSYMKQQLQKQLLKQDFDINNDKMLIKMGGVHLSKGFSPLGLFEVGNTLNEFAEFNGNRALNIVFSNRFYTENGKIRDILESTKKYDTRLKDLNQMGKKDEWVVIDLRPMVKGHFYNPVKYEFNKYIEDLVKRYDLLIIPRTEIDPTTNY